MRLEARFPPLCPARWLTLHLHLCVGFTVAVLVGGVADVLSWILPPHVSQSQGSIVNCVFPWQRSPEFGPGDDRRRGAWKKKQDITKEMAWKISQVTAEPWGEHLTAGLAHHGNGVSLHHRHVCGADRSHRRSRTSLHKELNLDLCYSFTVFSLADVNPRVFWMDRRPLRKDGHWCLLHHSEVWSQYYIWVRIHLYVFTCMTLALLASLVTSWRVEPWRFQVMLGRGLPVARHSTDTGSPILTRRGPDGVSRTLGATDWTATMKMQKKWRTWYLKHSFIPCLLDQLLMEIFLFPSKIITFPP